MNRQRQNQVIPESDKKRVVIVGGGFGGITLVKKLRNKGFQVVLIDKNNYHTFQPLLYQVATGGLEPDSIAFPLRKIFQGHRDFYFRMTEVKKIDAARKMIITGIGEVSYDYLVIAAGSVNNFFGMTGIMEKSMPMKSLTEALDLRSHLLQNIEKSINAGTDRSKYLNFVVAGGGPTGVETAGALCELKRHVLPNDYPELDFREARIILIEAGPRLLAGMSEQASAKAKLSLEKLGAEILLNTSVSDYDGNNVTLSNGNVIPSASFMWSAGVKGAGFEGISKEMTGRQNRILVDRFNRVTGMDHVFAIGDIALMTEEKYPNGHPMVAQGAIQMASNLALNLVAMEKSATLVPFRYKDLGSLATIGRNKAVADFPFIRLSGIIAWFLWLVVHLMTLVGFRNRVIVLINWMWNYFSYDRAIRLIVRPKKDDGQ
jgi:NADH:ubiquinone reductase (H+-translocating)